MFNFVNGVLIKNAEGIENGYEVTEQDGQYYIQANISAEKLEEFITDSLKVITTPGFLVLEVPTPDDVEEDLRENENDPFHYDVFYLDDGNNSDFAHLFNKYKTLLLNDGFVRFGFGSHDGNDELFVSDYKIINMYVSNKEKYEKIFEKHNIPRVKELRTVWDNFSESAPGKRVALEQEGETIYDIVETLLDSGLYFAERLEE